jgi:hypothetical protein
MTERELQDLFREMREEPVPVDSLARVRLAVAGRINERSWRGAWKIAAALVMAGCIVTGILLLRPARTVSLPAPAEIAQVAPAPDAPQEIPVRPVSRPKRASRPPRVEVVPVSIRIETPDPDVVILLVN